MDVSKVLAVLRQERDQIDEAILNLERLARGRGKPPGRPPSWMVETTSRHPAGRKKRPGGQKSSSHAA